MTTTRNIVTKNQKIVIIPVDKILGMKLRKCGVNKSPQVVNVSASDEKLFAADDQTVKGCRKRGQTGVGDGPKEKRLKMVPSAMKQCASVLENLIMTAPFGKCSEAKGNRGCANTGHKISALELSVLLKSLMTAEEKEKLEKMLSEVSRGYVPPCLRSFLTEIGVNRGGNIELDMDVFAEEILLKLRRIVRLVGARAKKKRDQEREAELKKQRERERKAAGLALEQVEKTVKIDDNFKTMKDFHMLIQSPLSHQYCDCKREILNQDREEGEIVKLR